MTDEQLDALVARTATVTDEQLTGRPLQLAAAELCEEIMSVPAIEDIRSVERIRPARPRPGHLVVAAAAAVFIAILGVVVTSIGGGSSRAWAAPLVEFAESSPQLLLDEGGWEVSRADQNGDGEGEMTFVNGDREADLFWRAGSFQDWASDRASGAARVETGTVLGHRAQISQYGESNDYAAVWPDGDRTIEFRSEADSVASFVDLLGRLRPVDVDAWLSAMPDRVIQSAERGAVVQEMLVGVPIPHGLDVDDLASGAGISDREQLGAEVTGAVGCAWAEQWVVATSSGDTAAAMEAAEAMATSHDWAILSEMSSQGAWPQIFWMIADGMAGDGKTVDGVSIAAFYGPALGCGG